jgi:hypothetical protein
MPRYREKQATTSEHVSPEPPTAPEFGKTSSEPDRERSPEDAAEHRTLRIRGEVGGTRSQDRARDIFYFGRRADPEVQQTIFDAEDALFGRHLDPVERAFFKGWQGGTPPSIAYIEKALGRDSPTEPDHEVGGLTALIDKALERSAPTEPGHSGASATPRLGRANRSRGDGNESNQRRSQGASVNVSGFDEEQRAYLMAWNLSAPQAARQPTVPMINHALGRNPEAEDRTATGQSGMDAGPPASPSPTTALASGPAPQGIQPGQSERHHGAPTRPGVTAAPVEAGPAEGTVAKNVREREVGGEIEGERSPKRPRYDDRSDNDHSRSQGNSGGLD